MATTLLAVSGDKADLVPDEALSALGLEERAHLQEWVIAHPRLLGEDVLVVTAEYDRWSGAGGVRARDRLDVLGLESSGRLVVAELKRDASGGDVHLQAVTYAALVSRFTLDSLAEAHQQFLTHRGEPLSVDAARGRLLEHSGELDPDLLRRPRIVLLAGSFPRQVTHTAVWLSEMGLDVDLVQVTGWRVGQQLLAGFTKVYPTAEVEEFTLSPTRAESGEVTRRAAERTRAANAAQRLIDAEILPDGTPLRLQPNHGTTAHTRAQIEAWVAEMPERAQATWRNDPAGPLVWAADDQPYKPTTLARHILAEAAGVQGSVRGPAWWVTEDGQDLTALADQVPGTTRRDWSDLHGLLAALPLGSWTTYGDLAQVIGTAAQPLGQHIARCDACPNFHRVLAASGRVAANFAWADPERTDRVEDVLAEEGVAFTDGVAEPARRLGPDRLQALRDG